MAKEQKVKFIDQPIFRLILTIASIVLASVILAFSALTIIQITNNDYTVADMERSSLR